MEKMLDLDSQKASIFEESKEKKGDKSKEIDTIVDDAKKLKLNESYAQVIGVPQNSNTHIGKCELFDCSVVFDPISSL